MAVYAGPRAPIRFGIFELDPDSRELRKDGVKLHLQDQPLHVLLALVERASELVSRDELRAKLWPTGTYVEFDDGLNAAIARLRQTLGDSAESPRFIQTVPRHGYRFIAPVVSGTPGHGTAAAVAAPPASSRPWRTSSALWAWALLAAAMLVAGGRLVARWRRPGLSAARLMLAVLPLQHLGEGPDESLADGLTEELTTVLARLNPERLGVIARTSMTQYKTQPKPISAIGRDLDVDYVLEGSVRRAGGRVRITAQLIEVEGQSHLWAQSYDRELKDIFDVEGDVAEAVGRQLSVRLLPEAQRARPPPHPEAHVAYLRGLHFWNKRSEAGLRRAVELFREAIDRDPGYARGHAGLAAAYASLATSADAVSAAEARALALAAARRALELDPDLAEGHAVLATIACRFDWNWLECERELRRTLTLDPSYATGRHLLGEHMLQRGRFEEAVAELKQARALDPLSPTIHTHLGLAHMYAGRYDEALSCYAQASEIDPDYLLAHRARGLTLVRSGRVEEGLAVLRHARTVDPRSARAAADLGHALGRTGRVAEARTVLAELETMAKQRPVSAYDFAVVRAGLGEKEAALQLLEKAYTERAGGLRWLKIEPIFDALRNDPRFEDLLRRVGIPD